MACFGQLCNRHVRQDIRGNQKQRQRNQKRELINLLISQGPGAPRAPAFLIFLGEGGLPRIPDSFTNSFLKLHAGRWRELESHKWSCSLGLSRPRQLKHLRLAPPHARSKDVNGVRTLSCCVLVSASARAGIGDMVVATTFESPETAFPPSNFSALLAILHVPP